MGQSPPANWLDVYSSNSVSVNAFIRPKTDSVLLPQLPTAFFHFLHYCNLNFTFRNCNDTVILYQSIIIRFWRSKHRRANSRCTRIRQYDVEETIHSDTDSNSMCTLKVNPCFRSILVKFRVGSSHQ